MSFRRRGGNPDKGDPEMVAFARRFGMSVTITSGIGHGYPDWTCGRFGVTVLIERKSKGGKLRESQKDFALHWNGGPLIAIETAQELQALLMAHDVLAHCRPLDLRVRLGYRESVPY